MRSGSWLLAGRSEAVSTPSWIAPRHLVQEHVREKSSSSLPAARISVVPLSARAAAMSESPVITLPPEAATPPPYPDLRQENDALRRQIAEMAAREAAFRRDVLHASEKDLVQLACAVAERVARRELRTDPEVILGWVREAIECLAAKEAVIVALGPELAIRLCTIDWRVLVGDFVRVETDTALAPWQCEVRAGAATVDCSTDGRLAAVSAALGVPVP